MSTHTKNTSAEHKALFLNVIYFFLVFLPPVMLIRFLIIYHVDVPFRDSWELVPLLEKLYEGNVSLQDLWTPHNEHRLLFPKIIMLELARLTGWNTSYEAAVNFILGAGIFSVLAHQIHLTAKEAELPALKWVLSVVSLVVFSASQWGNWLWGWQMQIFLNVFSTILGIVFLSHPSGSWRNFFIAVAAGFVSTYSFAGGTAYWAACLVILLFAPAGERKIKSWRLALWGIASAVCIALYMRGMLLSSRSLNVNVILHSLSRYITFAVAYLGVALDNMTPERAFLTGLSGILLFFYIGWILLFRYKMKFQLLMPYVSMCLYVFLNACLTALGRTMLGENQVLSYQYISLSWLFWIFHFVFMFYLLLKEPRLPNGAFREDRGKKQVFSLIYFMLIFLVTQRYVWGWERGFQRHLFLNRARSSLIQMQTDSYLYLLYPDIVTLKERAAFLKKHRLCVYKKQ